MLGSLLLLVLCFGLLRCHHSFSVLGSLLLLVLCFGLLRCHHSFSVLGLTQEKGKNYNHIEQKRIYERTGQKAAIIFLAKAAGRLRAGQRVDIVYDGSLIQLISVEVPKNLGMMGTIYLDGGLEFRASRVVVPKGI